MNFEQAKEHHYVVHTSINPTQVLPVGPDVRNLASPDGRASLGGRPFGDGTPPGPPVAAEAIGFLSAGAA